MQFNCKLHPIMNMNDIQFVQIIQILVFGLN